MPTHLDTFSAAPGRNAWPPIVTKVILTTGAVGTRARSDHRGRHQRDSVLYPLLLRCPRGALLRCPLEQHRGRDPGGRSRGGARARGVRPIAPDRRRARFGGAGAGGADPRGVPSRRGQVRRARGGAAQARPPDHPGVGPRQAAPGERGAHGRGRGSPARNRAGDEAPPRWVSSRENPSGVRRGSHLDRHGVEENC